MFVLKLIAPQHQRPNEKFTALGRRPINGGVAQIKISWFYTLKDSGGASGPALIKSLTNNKLWEDAKMGEVITYLSQSRFVHLPEAYAEAFS